MKHGKLYTSMLGCVAGGFGEVLEVGFHGADLAPKPPTLSITECLKDTAIWSQYREYNIPYFGLLDSNKEANCQSLCRFNNVVYDFAGSQFAQYMWPACQHLCQHSDISVVKKYRYKLHCKVNIP